MSKFVFALLPLLAAAAVEKPSDVQPVLCSSYNLPAVYMERYHGDHVCDRKNYNTFKANLHRHFTYQRLKKDNEINHVPNQKTVVCPLEVQDLMQQGQGPRSNGFDSVWVVENTSTEPVVLSFVKADGIEYSAVNPSITPPQNDPQAVLLQGRWKAIYAWEGHVFHARSYNTETGNLGPVVMQHRMGLIPVGVKFQDLDCPTDDPEPMINGQRDPNFQRTPPAVNRPCNTIDLGFRNMANCPLHGYFLRSINSTSCQEKFQFHLGKNTQPNDFMWGWDSSTKFEGTFVGHTYVFRSAAHPEILVDTVTLEPTRVTDCPELKVKAQVNQVTRVGELAEIGLPISNDGDVAIDPLRVKDTIVLVDRRVIASIFNETFGMNATTTSKPRRHRITLGPMVGIDSY